MARSLANDGTTPCAWSRIAPAACCFERRLAPIQHQHGVQRRRVERRRDAAPEGDRSGSGVVGQADVRRQRDGHEDGRVVEDPRDPVSVAIVAAVVEEERILRILQEPAPYLAGRQRAGALAMAGLHVRPLPPNVSRSKSRLPSSSRPKSAPDWWAAETTAAPKTSTAMPKIARFIIVSPGRPAAVAGRR